MSQANQQRFLSTVGDLPGIIQTPILNTSVKLTGLTPTGSTFTGSAVLLYQALGTATLVTAKHNLYIFNGDDDEPAWSSQLVTDFVKGVTINYDSPLAFNKVPTRTAPITAAEAVIPDENRPWAYDILILTSTDANLVTFAMTEFVYAQSFNGVDMNYLVNDSLYLARLNQTFIQTGYGTKTEVASNVAKTIMPTDPKPGTNVGGALQFRTCEPKAATTATVYNQRSDVKTQYDQFVNAIQLSADPNSSTAPGDSGGPLFVVTTLQNKPRFFLIGITTGADMPTAQTPFPPASGPLRANNIATSLAYCYRNSLISY